MRHVRLPLAKLAAALAGGVALVLALLPFGTAAGAVGCGSVFPLHVPGAERQQTACLADLTTAGLAGTGYTDPADYAGLHAPGTNNPSGVPGVQIDGYFSDTSSFNTDHGWNHDAQFVIRLPDNWNGKLVVTGAPGVRKQYSLDFLISDWVLARGYAFAATDKGNSGVTFYRDGRAPGEAIVEWNRRVAQLTQAAKGVVQERYGRRPARTYVTGISNGGYLTRYALEHQPELYDGGVDWEGTLFRAEGPNLLTYLPTALKHYPAYAATGSPAAHDAMLAAGFAPGSEFLWDIHYRVYWDLTQRIYRQEFDPSYSGPFEAGIPFCASGTQYCDADYDYFSRPPSVRAAVAKVSLTGRIGKPLITLQGTLDSLLPIATDSDVYERLVQQTGRGDQHRYYRVEAGNHVDGFYALFPDRLRPILPCYRAAFEALEGWVERQQPPPESHLIPRPSGGDIVNSCSLS
jgi:Tannase and feruloyl esterase/3HB-oligomer hydrolase (3HBOH)